MRPHNLIENVATHAEITWRLLRSDYAGLDDELIHESMPLGKGATSIELCSEHQFGMVGEGRTSSKS
ncbi:hypothetical protein D3C78_1896060 [compost metagenome]